jgi:hypothetical protein
MVKTIMKDSTLNFDDLIAFHTTEADYINRLKRGTFKFKISNIEL